MTTNTTTLTARAHAAYEAHVAADLANRTRNSARDRDDTTAMLRDVLLGKFDIDAPVDAITWHSGAGAYAQWESDGIAFRMPVDGDAKRLTWSLVCTHCGGPSRAVGSLGPDTAAHGLAILGAWLNTPVSDRCADCGKAVTR